MKLDGYRTLAAKDTTRVKLWSRRGHLVNEQFPDIAEACNAFPANTLLDGEIVALDEGGKISFNLLQHHRSKASALKFYAFDALIVDGRSLIGQPLTERRFALENLISPSESALDISETFNVSPDELIRTVKRFDLEGVVAKRKESAYEPGKRRVPGSNTRSIRAKSS